MDQAANDTDLIARIAEGDQAAVRALFARHHTRVYRFVLRMVGNEATAEDITNDVYMEVWRNAAKFEGRSAVSTWMLSIARNKTLSQLRKRSEAQLDDEYAAEIPDGADTPETNAAKADKGAQIRACMDALSHDHREIIDLVYYHEKSVSEVAEIIGIPEGTVKTRMFHARKKLGDVLNEAGLDRGWP